MFVSNNYYPSNVTRACYLCRSDFSPNTTPSVHCGALSPSNSSSGEFSSSLSPTLLGDLSLPFTELNLDTVQPPSAFRVRSHSVTERTVAPSDTWSDPAARTGVRSAPSTTSPLPEDEHTTPGIVSECNAYQFGGEIVSPGSESSFFASHDELYLSETGLEQVAYHPHAGNTLLLRPEIPHTESDPSTSFSHRRVYSDPLGFLSPTSPVDQWGSRMQHRRTSSASGSVRHAPYPASAPATPEARFGLPELVDGYGVQRRHTRPSSRPKLSINVPYSVMSTEDPTSNQYIYPMLPGGDQEVLSHVPSIACKSEWGQANEIHQPSSSTQFVHGSHGMMDSSSMHMADQLSPNSAVSSASSPGWKDVVGSQKIVDASHARRKRESKFVCEVPGCGQTFTAKHNWNCAYSILSFILDVGLKDSQIINSLILESDLSHVASATTASPLQEWLIGIVRSALGLADPPSVDVPHHPPHHLRINPPSDAPFLHASSTSFNAVLLSRHHRKLFTLVIHIVANTISTLRFPHVLRSAFLACLPFYGLVSLFGGATTLYVACFSSTYHIVSLTLGLSSIGCFTIVIITLAELQ